MRWQSPPYPFNFWEAVMVMGMGMGMGMAMAMASSGVCFLCQSRKRWQSPPTKKLEFCSPILCLSSNGFFQFASNSTSNALSPPTSRFSSPSAPHCSPRTAPLSNLDYQFTDASSEVELRLQLGSQQIPTSKHVFVDANETSLTIKLQRLGSTITLLQTQQLFDKIKPAETIWYIDEDQLVISLKKHDPDFKWPDVVESWESLTGGSAQLLKGASIYLIGDSTDINQKVAQELAVGLGYTPLSTKDLLETFSKQTIDSWTLAEGSDAVAQAENAVLESLSSHVRAVVATLGGQPGAAGRADTWRHLYAGFTVWLSQTEATDESAAKEEARRHMQKSKLAYSNAEVVVKLQGWDDSHSKAVAQATLRALKQLILSDKKLPDKKSVYIRLGCRGDWPNIKPPGWDPAADAKTNSATF